MRKLIEMAGVTTLAFGLVTHVAAQQDFSAVKIETTALGGNLFVLSGRGGNIGVSTGDDGVFVIDDQFAPLSEKILSAIGELSDQPVSYVLNTHWHGDHTGGNENFGAAGAVIVAHENVRERMSTPQFMKAFAREVPAAPGSALPVVTFSDDITFFFNGHAIEVMHQPHAHTDGDSIVWFSQANVLHMGDTFFNGIFPFVDQSSGGSVPGIIAAVEAALTMTDENTQIIPGHGPMAGKGDLEGYHSMLKDVMALMTPLVQSGKSREEVLAADPLADIGKQWGKGFMSTKVFTGIVYDTEAGN